MARPPHNPYRYGERIEQVIAHHARQTPDAPGLQQDGAILTYLELMERADRVATGLRERGIGAGDIVPVLLDRSVDLVCTLLGVLSAGAVYIAMDRRWPSERIAGVVGRSGARLVVTADDRHPVAGLPAVGRAQLLAGTEKSMPPRFVDGTAAACVFYTSGSTGRPKGVLAPHRGVIRTLVDYPSIPLSADTVMLQAAPLPWDGFALELWAALLNGGRCVLMDRGAEILEPSTLRSAIAQGVNTLWLTSSLFGVLAEEATELFSTIRLLMVGGERVSPAHVRRVMRRFPGLQVVNGYGPAESTIFTTTHPIRPQDVRESSTEVPLGTPVPRTGVVLLDDAGAVDDQAGEIAVCGDGLALEYLGDPEETARRFMMIDGVRYYRTGDLGVRDEEGNLRYRGRSDRQIKINGIRIEPGEIDAVVEGHPEVSSAHTVLTEPRLGERFLATAYTTRDGAAIDSAVLRDFAAQRLIAAMLPDRLVHLPALPLAGTGKADAAAVRRAVLAAPAPAADASPGGSAGAPGPRDELLELVRDTLRLPRLTASDDFLQAGASSLDIMRLCARIESRLGVPVMMAEAYRRRTVRALSEMAGPAGPVRSSAPAEARDGVALSAAQRRFWMAEQFNPGAMDNVIQLAYLLSGPLRPQALRAAWDDVAARHPVLRSCYPIHDGEPSQRILPTRQPVWEWLEIEPGAANADPEALTRRLSAPWWEERFDLEAAPPIRLRVVRLTADRHLLFMHAHHIAFDGWSESVLLTELAAAYAARCQDDPVPSATPAMPTAKTHARTDIELPYWQARFDGDVSRPLLPLAGKATAAAPRREIAFTVPAEQVHRLRKAADRYGGPLTAAFLAGVGRALHRLLGVSRAVVGTTSAGRHTDEDQAAIGYFVNPLPVSLADLDGSADRVLVTTVEATLDALEHARVPFDDLVRALSPNRDRHPLFQVWAVLQQRPATTRLGPDVRVRPIRLRAPRTALELVMEALPDTEGAWEVVVQWRVDGIEAAAAEKLTCELRDALAVLADTAFAS